jgi:hypothetical protein
MLRILAVAASLQTAGALKLSLEPRADLGKSAYDKLIATVAQKLENITEQTHLCFGHSSDGAASMLKAGADGKCDAGVVVLGAAPSLESLAGIRSRVLIVAGDLDGVMPFSHFAVARHRSSSKDGCRFAVLRDASHMSFASGPSSEAVAAVDLQPAIHEDAAHDRLAEIVHDFVRGDGAALRAAERSAAELAGPVVDALKLEGSAQLGHPACNSDWPTNPTCKYPKWPDHSLPFGPSPAPSPPLPTDCICGSPWVADTAANMAYGLPAGVSAETKDSFHDVSDTHPFHLPNIFNKCDKPDASCVLNVTTVTMPVLKAGNLWPNSSASQPLSAYEFRTKLKSREAIFHKANVPGAGPDLDNSSKVCASINKAAYEWALEHAEASVLQRFKSKGEPFAMVDDVEATIGATGPEWIEDELVYKRVSDSASPTGTHIEIQSWKFVVGNTNGGSVPWFFPVGMHYCKLLSPARAMEWIYTDSMRKAPITTIVV